MHRKNCVYRGRWPGATRVRAGCGGLGLVEARSMEYCCTRVTTRTSFFPSPSFGQQQVRCQQQGSSFDATLNFWATILLTLAERLFVQNWGSHRKYL